MKRLAAVPLLLLLTACGSVHIARINADPSRYANRTVTVTGRVVTSVGVLGKGGYELDDGTGRIYVISGTGVPSRGSTVKVTGAVSPGVQVLGSPVGVAIREQQHRVK
jgi:hypothetical protein